MDALDQILNDNVYSNMIRFQNNFDASLLMQTDAESAVNESAEKQAHRIRRRHEFFNCPLCEVFSKSVGIKYTPFTKQLHL